jgi:uncharacterized protein (DUF302 family)
MSIIPSRAEEHHAMSPPDHGFLDIRSHRPVAESIERLQSLASAAGLMIFARIDFSGDAQRAGLTMRPMQMLLFGNPKAGTPLLIASPRVGLDLPLKALAWEDAEGSVWLSCNAPAYLEARHDLPHALIANIAGAQGLLERAAAP